MQQSHHKVTQFRNLLFTILAVFSEKILIILWLIKNSLHDYAMMVESLRFRLVLVWWYYGSLFFNILDKNLLAWALFCIKLLTSIIILRYALIKFECIKARSLTHDRLINFCLLLFSNFGAYFLDDIIRIHRKTILD